MPVFINNDFFRVNRLEMLPFAGGISGEVKFAGFRGYAIEKYSSGN